VILGAGVGWMRDLDERLTLMRPFAGEIRPAV